MGKYLNFTLAAVLACSAIACTPEKKEKDRSASQDMFDHITSLTKSYIHKIEAAEDSAAWVRVNLEFEDSLQKVNFSYPADTDLLLSEDQNDSIVRLTRDYVKARDSRIRDIIHPIMPADTIDSVSNLTVN